MRRLMFFLSGEHPSLPTAEVFGAIEAERRVYKVDEELDQVLILETKADPRVLASRLAMTHWIGEHICTAPVSEVLDAVGSSDLVDIIPHGKSFAVKVKRVKRCSPEIDAMKLARKIADLIRSEVDFKVDLFSPDVEILAVLTGGRCAVGIKEVSINIRQFRQREPKRRAAFHPGTIKPKLARCMVNLARTPRGGVMLDPFAGVGGILLEAGLIGARAVGVDIDPKSLEGAEKNLKQFGVTDYELLLGDARRLELEGEVDAIATDPPYGRQASTGGLELPKIYEQALPGLVRALRPGRHMCITSPSEIALEDFAEDAGFKLVEKHSQRVHKSLTRNIYVFRKRRLP